MRSTSSMPALSERSARRPKAADRPSLDRFIFPANLLADSSAVKKGADRQGDSTPAKAGSFDSPSDSDLRGESIASDSAGWWLVYTKSRQEKRLSEQLSEMRVPHYLPVHAREAMTRGRVRVVEEPLFSGYLFLHADDEQRRTALTTNRISATHPVADAPRLRHELSQIAKSISAGAHLTIEAKLEPGDWVRVKTGPYRGLEGTVLRRKNTTKLLLSVNFLKQGASLELPDCSLELIDPPTQFDGSPTIEIVGRRGL